MTMEQQGRQRGKAPGSPRPTGGGGTAAGRSEGRQIATASSAPQDLATVALMEVITERTNLNLAHERVVSNGGAPGVDGMTVDDLKAWCRTNGSKLIWELLEGSYEPQPVRGKKIPKAGGGERQLGIPTVVDTMVPSPSSSGVCIRAVQANFPHSA